MRRSALEDTESLVHDLQAMVLDAPPACRIWLAGVREELSRVLIDLDSARERVSAREARVLRDLTAAPSGGHARG